MSEADRIETWLRADVEPDASSAGSGRCVVVTRKSPDRGAEEHNEDGAAVLSWRGRACVLALADGLGGHGEGDVAARMVLTRIAKRVGAGPYDGASIQSAILGAIEEANEALRARSGSAATTVLVASVRGDQFRSYHAGDSELLVVGQRGKIKYQSVSHSPVGYAVEAGVLDREDSMAHDERHLISNFVGREAMRVEVTTAIRLAPRDTVVLASDGLWDNLYVHEVAEHVRKGPLNRAAASLAELATRRMAGEDQSVAGKPDDLTIILFRRR